MKKTINVFVTFCVIVLLKGFIMAPVYLCFAPFVTACQWGFRMSTVKCAIPFEFKCVWHTLQSDWRDGCETIIFDLSK